ncbi:PD-(D/E)XK nuclease family protein [Streptomyces formicae]|uniref:PD-(D/E)XK nuclease family protein n=1 Tax=Streptomyces formicae TaxID=1616117 RepID=A0ABY3WLS9_9ACTN|nr:PD-(D/E)XK nuclease family protein [Streptomyces formicae]UNM12292.1 PD-(D/E)XK nuclease family protein [Streptomyces formicae]
MNDPPKHISHSAREILERCAKSYFLKYFTEAPRLQSLWLAGGSAVHEATEVYDLQSVAGIQDGFDLEAAWRVHFELQLEQLREKEPNENAWRRSQSEDIETWRRIGLQFVQEYIDWRERSPWEIWTTPDGEPAIELDISGRLPGCSVEIKAYLDRVFYDPVFKKHWIVDLKTSKRPPKTPDQFRTYGALMEVKYGIRPEHGAAFMNRQGGLSRPVDLGDVTPKEIGAVYGEAWKKVTSGYFPAEGIAKNDCFLCDVQSSCHAKGGPYAQLHDPDHPGYQPPF